MFPVTTSLRVNNALPEHTPDSMNNWDSPEVAFVWDGGLTWDLPGRHRTRSTNMVFKLSKKFLRTGHGPFLETVMLIDASLNSPEALAAFPDADWPSTATTRAAFTTKVGVFTHQLTSPS